MAIPANPNQVSLSDIYDEYTDTHNGSAEIQLSDYYDTGNAPSTGNEIQIGGDFHGTSNVSYTSATGGTITTYTSGGVNYKVHSFTSSGTFAVSSVGTPDATISCLVVAGGGGAGSNGSSRFGGGGGAGGMEYYDPSVPMDNTTVGGQDHYYNQHINIGRGRSKTITAQDYTIVIGSGGSGGGSSSARRAGNGGTGSYIRLADGSTYMVICRGGGGGHGDNYTGSDGGSFGGRGGMAGRSNATAGDGGSGGGGFYGSWSSSPRGAAQYYNNQYDTSGDNYAVNTFTGTTSIEGGKAGNGGGTGVNSTGYSFSGGGGGGAGGGGTSGGYRSSGSGRGGAAKSNTIRTGSAVYYATGGASGAGYVISGASVQGANRPSGEYVAEDYEDHVFTGNANTGDAGDNNGTGYAGGSGIVVIRYVVA